MKLNRLYISAAMALVALPLAARMPEASDIKVTDIKAARNGNALDLSFFINCNDVPRNLNVETRVTPMLCGPADTLRMESVTLAGKNRYIQAKRTGDIRLDGNRYYRVGKIARIDYRESLGWQKWMETATLQLEVENLGCCRSVMTAARDLGLARLNMGERTFNVDMNYITPIEEKVKMRNAHGEAYIDFVVNTVNIRPDYRRNSVELAKIRATIDSIKSDKDTKITTLAIKGYASPEGSYANNERLAKGRTEALAEYVRKLYTFPKDLMKTSFEAEDWAGLRKRVAESDIANKAGILAVIDSKLAPDAKDAKLKKDFPTQYAFMLREWYPALRHSDYEVAYEVKKYYDPKEIAEVFRKNPNKLSLREFFILAETLKPNSPEYRAVFETAARLNPDSQTANLNAANCAISAGDLSAGAEYLSKAGDTPQAAYARGVLAAKQHDYATAKTQFEKAQAGGLDITAALAALARAQAPEVELL